MTIFSSFSKTKLGLLIGLFPTAAALYSINKYKKNQTLFGWRNETSIVNIRQDVFFASNSLIYGIDNASTSVNKIPPIVVLAPVWLEKTHKSHHTHKWGQTALGLPDYPRMLFHQLYPNYPNNEYLTWKQILEIRQLEIEKLEKLHQQGKIVLHDLRSADIKKYERGELLHLGNKDEHYILYSNEKEIFKIPEKQLGTIYNFLSRPQEVSQAQAQLGLKTHPHTELYYCSPDEIPKTLLIGGTGLSTVWIRKHFPKVENLFVLARRKDSKIPKIPSNEEVDYESIYLVTDDDLLIDEKTGFFAIKHPLTKKFVTEIDPSTCFYTAIGYRPYSELTECIPKDHKLTLEDAMDLTWTAPKNIPVGSMTQRLMTFYYLSEFYEDYNYAYEMQYYTEHVTPMQLQNLLQKKGIELHINFFEHLRNAIIELDNPLEQEYEVELYMKAFSFQTPSQYEKEQFRLVIEEMQQSILNRKKDLYDIDSSSSMSVSKK